MSLPSSSVPRSTPGRVPPTQNTAPVLKFRCLFTHDLRRKAKRWQDGFLRFHTFNKRAMVYDEMGNFIGDHHWRESGEIQDGDELELDKGVLVQVGECMEKTQNDISALFEKRKASQESPTQQKPTIPPSSRVSMSSQGPPLKSLNDVLGIKRPSIGRSITPQSPYEQRHQQSHKSDKPDNAEGDRPAKRQKQQPGKVLQRKSTNEPLRRPPVIDLEKEPFPGRTADKADSASKIPLAPSIPAQGRSEKSSADTRPEKTEPPINPLRISNEKPRQKLMYRALLPPKDSNKVESTDTSQTRQVSSYDSDAIDVGAGSYSNHEFSVLDSTLALFDELTNTAVKRDVTSAAERPPKESPSQDQRKTLYARPSHSEAFGSSAESEMDSDSPPQESVSHATAAGRTAPLARSSSDVAATTANPAETVKRAEPKIFRKSLSDTTALRNQQQQQQQSSRPVPTKGPPGRQPSHDDGETGPWTSEALDFFDWWPPDRPKPA